MQEMKPIKEGKVREIYDNGDSLIMVATDRISCFDEILNNQVTKKGTVLTQMSKFWFDMTKDIVPNHMISVDVKDMPEFFQRPEFDGNSMLCRKLNMLIVYVIITIIRNIIEPRIVGSQLGLHPVVTLVSMFVGAQLFGVLGLFGFPITLSLLRYLNENGTVRLFK